MSRPIVVIACIPGSSESWELQQHPHLWHSRAGGGAVHSIRSGYSRLAWSELYRNFKDIHVWGFILTGAPIILLLFKVFLVHACSPRVLPRALFCIVCSR